MPMRILIELLSWCYVRMLFYAASVLMMGSGWDVEGGFVWSFGAVFEELAHG